MTVTWKIVTAVAVDGDINLGIEMRDLPTDPSPWGNVTVTVHVEDDIPTMAVKCRTAVFESAHARQVAGQAEATATSVVNYTETTNF